jgi:dephospho-CoA kinase
MATKKKLVLAIVGMCGSGKSEVVKYLKKKLAAPMVYFGTATFDELTKAGLEVNEKNERYMREKIRKDLGMGAYATLNLPKITKLLKENNVVLIESLYSWSEYKIIKKKFGEIFKVVAVVASPAVRQKRAAHRKERPLNKKESLARDYSEIENVEKGGPIAMADYIIVNEGTLKDLHKKLDGIK